MDIVFTLAPSITGRHPAIFFSTLRAFSIIAIGNMIIANITGIFLCTLGAMLNISTRSTLSFWGQPVSLFAF